MSKEKANVKLRGLFASMMWLPIVESDKLPRNTVVECIKANVSKDFLTVNLCASKVDDTHLSLLARCMHKNLTRVDLNFWMCPRLTGKGVEDLARQMPSKLKTLKLNFKLLGQRLIENTMRLYTGDSNYAQHPQKPEIVFWCRRWLWWLYF